VMFTLYFVLKYLWKHWKGTKTKTEWKSYHTQSVSKKTEGILKIQKVIYLAQKWMDFKNNGTTGKLLSIPFKWVPMLWGFNRVIKCFLYDFGDKSRPRSIKG
jgi:hypothetical protein